MLNYTHTFRMIHKKKRKNIIWFGALLMSCLSLTVTSATLPITVQHFPFFNELPANNVHCIYQDCDGIMWLGTSDGLCRYDGYNIHIFRSNSKQTELLSDNVVKSLAETRDGRLLLGTNKGLNVFDKKTLTFASLTLSSDLSDYEVRSLAVDQDGYVWVGSYIRLMRLSPDLTKIQTYSDTPVCSVNFVSVDASGEVWAGFWERGLYRYNRKEDRFDRMPMIGRSNNPFRLFQDTQNRYWIATYNDGLFRMAFKQKPTDTRYNQVDIVNPSLDNGNIERLYGLIQDEQSGHLWMVGAKGLTIATIMEDGQRVKIIDTKELALQMNNIFNGIYKDKNGVVWIGASCTGGYLLNYRDNHITKWPLDEIRTKTPNIMPYITTLYKDSSDIFWICQNIWGLGWYNPGTQSLHFYYDIPELANDQTLMDIAFISSSPFADGEVWVGTQFAPFVYVFRQTDGLPKLKEKIDLKKIGLKYPVSMHTDAKSNCWIATTTGLAVLPRNGKLQLVNVKVPNMTTLTEDAAGNLWIGSSSHGLFQLASTFQDGICHAECHEIAIKGDVNLSRNVISLCMDNFRGQLWIGTQEGQVQSLDIRNGELTDHSELFTDYMNEAVCKITIDKLGYLWISSARHVIVYNPVEKTMRSYTHNEKEGLNFFADLTKASFYDGKEHIYYGGDGITAIQVIRNITQSRALANPVITDLKVRGQSIFDRELRNDYQIDLTKKKIVLGADAQDIELDFSTLDYIQQGRILYAYCMKGINNNWIYTQGATPRAYFNDLSKGTYQLRVRATDRNGQWGKEVVFTIVRLPAYYETWWACLIYTFLFAAIVYYAFRVVKKRIRLRNELTISRIEIEKTEELTQAKLRYFTNISHDFLTPVSIISCLIDDMEMTYKPKIPQLDKMRISLYRLKRLLQQVLDFRKIENGKMELKVATGDITYFLRQLCDESFGQLMEKKNIAFQFNASPQSLIGYFDEDKVGKIVYNLLSNAYKYTDTGTVSVSLTQEEKEGHRYALISVSDTGHGIASEDIKCIFTRFYTANNDKEAESNGIGLSLVEELTELHHAHISVESQLGKGSCFTLSIPLDKDCYQPEERLPDAPESIDAEEEKTTVEETSVSSTEVLEQAIPSSGEEKEYTILIVEDNSDLLEALTHVFSADYQVLTATNGAEALTQVKTATPDIVVSDIMMSVMDGLEFCRMVKQDMSICQIPVILLTAKNSPEDRVECYKAGAEGYISKPFEMKVLRARIESLLTRKRKRQEEFLTAPQTDTDVLEIAPVDKEFLDYLIGIIQRDFTAVNLDMITQEMALSKSSLYRKMKQLTGLSTSDFISNIRMKHAYELLVKGNISVEEVAFQSGFSDRKYFSTCFKKQFGIAPSVLLRK